ncbi:hypothetical protein AB0O91_05825 [Kitasatospora sp. NPDC089797]|uniref:hypothetical protein n=1 Tax=Kitasatospora sp. NPDC089797 TaxID=3155298 RepID=UPI00344A484F
MTPGGPLDARVTQFSGPGPEFIPDTLPADLADGNTTEPVSNSETKWGLSPRSPVVIDFCPVQDEFDTSTEAAGAAGLTVTRTGTTRIA